MYDNALDRAPPPDGLANWVSQIAAGLPLSDVVIAFADSAESKALRAGPTTELVLAGPGGINMSVPTTCAGVSEVRLSSAREPRAPAPAEENPTSVPIPPAMSGNQPWRSER